MANKMVKISVKRIARVLRGRKGYDYLSEGCSKQDAMRDLLTDVRHYAGEKGLDFDKAVKGSKDVAKEEATD